VLHMPRNNVATLCRPTTCFNVKDVCILPALLIYIYIYIYILLFSQYTAVVSLNSINLLNFVVEMHCILRSGMTEKLSTIQTNFRFQSVTVELDFFIVTRFLKS
jgi:hypothetical protein